MRVFDNRVLRRIFEPKRDEATGEWRKLHNDELNNLYSSPSIFRVIKSRSTTWRNIQHVWGKAELYTGFWWGSVRERVQLEDPDADGRIILRWIFRKWDVRAWNGTIWLRIGTGGRHL
jgi:hypothetical protein